MKEVWIVLDSRGIGGIETHVKHLANTLKEVGTFKPKVLFLKKYNFEHPMVTDLKNLHIDYDYLTGFQDLYKRIKQEKPYCLHTHGYKSNILGRLASLMNATLNTVSTFHAGDLPTWKIKIWDFLDRGSSFLSKNICVSKSIQDKQFFKTHLIPNFIIVPETQQVKTDKTLLNIAFVGRLSYEKGCDDFIKSALLDSQNHYHIFGDGPEKENLQNLIQGKTHNIVFHGIQNMENHWKDIDILTITSRNEGLPLVALEAMANNVFVISYDVGGLKNLLIGDDGVCYGSIIPQSHHMIEALQEQIRLFQAMTQNAKNDILFQAWKRVYEKYSSKVIIKDIETIYREFNQKSS